MIEPRWRYDFTLNDFEDDSFRATLDVQKVFRETYVKMMEAEGRVEDEAVAQYLRDKGWKVEKS